MPLPHPAPDALAPLLVPYAMVSAPECQALAGPLALPNLQALLALLQPEPADEGNDHTLNPPNERALARALGLVQADGLPFADGQIPWAAADSSSPEQAQAWFTPCHFQVGMDQVTLLPTAQLGLGDDHARPLFDALAPFCTEDGIALHYESATRWRAVGEPLRGLRCASLERVSGRALGDWMPDSPANPTGSQLLKRLTNEAQMLFYTHPASDARDAARQYAVNGFWVHGAGAWASAGPLLAPPTELNGLRQAALQGDWAAWAQAWATLDAGPIKTLLTRARAGHAVHLTLCGERHARTWKPPLASSGLARLSRSIQQRLRPQPVVNTLLAL